MLLFNNYTTHSGLKLKHFNTSNVTIQRGKMCIIFIVKIYFNTSNVTIQLDFQLQFANDLAFQYI